VKQVEQVELAKAGTRTRRLLKGRRPGAAGIIAAAVVLLGLGALLGWAAATLSQKSLPISAQQREAGTIVMVSGRDDHGLVQQAMVPLLRAPEDTTEVARVPDGSFARVVEQRGEWLRVEAIGGSQATGWVNDFYLRNRALRLDGAGQVDFVDARILEGQVWISVRPVSDAKADPVWVNAAVLQEIGADNDR
jgi:hypothetical protein